MDQLAEFFVSIGSFLGLGGVMLVAGVVLLVKGRSAEEDRRKTMQVIGWPLVGCGGCLVVLPLIIIFAVLALGFAILSSWNGA